MLPDYVVLLIFFILSVLVPALTMFGSQLMRRTTVNNDVATLNYESAEESIGERIAIMKEYIYYFSMFLALEIVVAILLLWVLAAQNLPRTYSYAALGLIVMGFVFEVLVMLLARGDAKNER